ncbi:unnamed protein product [Polarella glacialis]|uniref:Alpha-1,2-mannosidase n=1 Tax=Polarella glacialis TaxID=89957 RepID=A0A813DIM5_POLGL|nr:unnamed protein product [Polarella glacialis]
MAKSQWDYNSGYHRPPGATSSPLLGFGLTALSGTGLNDGGDFILLPVASSSSIAVNKHNNIIAAQLLHDSTEQASPGYYRCTLQSSEATAKDTSRLEVELVAQLRSGMMRVRFGPGSAGHQRALIVNLGSPQDRLEQGTASQKTPLLTLWTRSSAATHHCSTDHTAYAAIETSVPVSSLIEIGRGMWLLQLEDQQVEELVVRVGLSQVDEAGALTNLRAELDSWHFDATVASARGTWNSALGRVRAESDDKDLVRFYSALYHAMMGPTLFSDVDRRYRLGGRGKIEKKDFDFYSTFSLWDTYRAEHPLLNLLFPELAVHLAKSLLAMKQQTGKLPRWVLYGKETGCMIGYPAANVLSEAALKGLLRLPGPGSLRATQSLELEALEAAVDTSKRAEGAQLLDRLIPVSPYEYGGVSKALEYAWSDSCIAKLAGRLGKEEQKKHYVKRSQLYRLNFDSGKKLILPRGVGLAGPDHSFVNLAPSDVNGATGQHYVEGTPLQYTFMVPHEVPRLVDLLGGQSALSEKLDTYFERSAVTDHSGGRDLETGHLGGHVQGNEPGHHIPYLYNAAGAPWRAQELLDRLMAMYGTGADGLPGNDDVGQMSAWFVFSALGFYPVDPCDGAYSIGRPLLRRAVLQLASGSLHVIAHNQSLTNKYLQSASWNGKPLSGFDIQHAEIVHGGELLFVMGASPTDFRKQPAPPPCQSASASSTTICSCGSGACTSAKQQPGGLDLAQTTTTNNNNNWPSALALLAGVFLAARFICSAGLRRCLVSATLAEDPNKLT